MAFETVVTFFFFSSFKELFYTFSVLNSAFCNNQHKSRICFDLNGALFHYISKHFTNLSPLLQCLGFQLNITGVSSIGNRLEIYYPFVLVICITSLCKRKNRALHLLLLCKSYYAVVFLPNSLIPPVEVSLDIQSFPSPDFKSFLFLLCPISGEVSESIF